MPVAREGMTLIALSLVLAILFFLIDFKIPAFVVGFFFLFCLFFFRNPKRHHSINQDELISPADGKVMETGEIEESEFLRRASKRVCIFMSLADVHVNRAPCEGKIVKVEHRRGDFALAFKKDIDKENERNYILMEHGDERILLVQVAGFLARRITSYVKEGDVVEKGDPVGIIAFGSRVDIYFPEGYDIVVSSGDKVKAGMTVLAKKRSMHGAKKR
jgi:phosphatidylserine decarboxylase